ncbi:MAG: hypothetical protein AAFX99_23470 [Myxococcota bacterium]
MVGIDVVDAVVCIDELLKLFGIASAIVLHKANNSFEIEVVSVDAVVFDNNIVVGMSPCG